ncbi:hypothetical protein ANCDUO_10554 [Ancylostoma duodenale]|uniref:Uncharacterized protein n=1 Tax=Ancylostoma duodenale TaxID=51022 RepID=A0A0C2CR05_9BILA|nr:hypothetical protein ANCDUO_10554 [Ancylostoma duodenale]
MDHQPAMDFQEAPSTWKHEQLFLCTVHLLLFIWTRFRDDRVWSKGKPPLEERMIIRRQKPKSGGLCRNNTHWQDSTHLRVRRSQGPRTPVLTVFWGGDVDLPTG